MRASAMVGLGALFSSLAYGQEATASVPAFEVASVKVNTSGAPASGDAKGDRLTLYNMPLKVIVARAYQVTNDKVTGPAWLDTDSYDIVAKFAPDTARRDLWLMLQNLLVERKSTRLNSSHLVISYAVFCLKKK